MLTLMIAVRCWFESWMLRCYTMAKQPYIFLSKQALSVSRKIQTRRFTANGSFGALAQQRKRTTEGISFRVIVVLHDLLVSRSDSLCVFSPLPQQTRMAGLQDAIFVLQTVGFFYCVSAFLWCFSSNLKITFIFASTKSFVATLVCVWVAAVVANG